MHSPRRNAVPFIRRKTRVIKSSLTTGTKTLLASVTFVSALLIACHAPQERGILIYVPVHQASVKDLGDFATCMTQIKPVFQWDRFEKRVDLLIVTNGNRELNTRDGEAVRRSMRMLAKQLPQISRVSAA